MPTFIMLTKIAPSFTRELLTVEELGREIGVRVRAHCPSVKWTAHYAILGPYDFMDIFEAKDQAEASEVALITSTVGGATTETWGGLPYEKFVEVAKDAAKP
ncbi:MAG: GYD domain-containing protein [Verrucomicrobia bacterium]|nr:GYD domain-containing protein [Verrucomicrobiota bacterium]